MIHFPGLLEYRQYENEEQEFQCLESLDFRYLNGSVQTCKYLHRLCLRKNIYILKGYMQNMYNEKHEPAPHCFSDRYVYDSVVAYNETGLVL